MPDKYGHLTDEELLLAADGELNARDAEEARQHLHSCWECRTRTAEMEASIAEFVHLHHAELDVHIPSSEGPRSLLKARMAEAVSQPNRRLSWHVWAAKFSARKLAYLSAGLLVLGLSAQLFWHRTPSSQLNREMRAFFDGPEPDSRLTPGRFRAVPLQQVCTAATYEQARVTSISLKQKVFQEYGMTGATTSNYEVDFLVTPELGGTDDIQNLWPEPYSSTVWNAHVKDELEDRLHELVCEQKVDLQTAQHDIATDWIAAYKKYFHTDKPLSVGSNI
jgi:hypothetical protein